VVEENGKREERKFILGESKFTNLKIG